MTNSANKAVVDAVIYVLDKDVTLWPEMLAQVGYGLLDAVLGEFIGKSGMKLNAGVRLPVLEDGVHACELWPELLRFGHRKSVLWIMPLRSSRAR